MEKTRVWRVFWSDDAALPAVLGEPGRSAARIVWESRLGVNLQQDTRSPVNGGYLECGGGREM